MGSFMLLSCSHKHDEKEEHEDHAHEAQKEESGHHHDEEENEAGISFDEHEGLTVSEETSKAIGLKIQAVSKDSLSPTIAIPFQVYRDANEESLSLSGFKKGNAYATAFAGLTSPIKQGSSGSALIEGQSLKAKVFKLDKQTQNYTGQVEVLIEIEDPQGLLHVGQTVQVELALAKQENVIAMPASAVLKTATEGTVAYIKEGEFFKRVKLEIGSENKEQIIITSGLKEGDQLVTEGVKTLWFSELRAVKGGGHSH
jgi:hypothetical protein